MDWKFPEDVRGWLTKAEGFALAELARGKAVLEIGSFCGLSTICMAQTAESVQAVDPFDGRATAESGVDTLDEFKANLKRYGVNASPHRGTSSIVSRFANESFDLIFIDGDHRKSAVLFDAKVATRTLRPGGLLVFHDYQRPIDPGVTDAVDELITSGCKLVKTIDSLAIVDPSGCERLMKATESPHVALTMCRRGPQINDGAAEAFYQTACRKSVIAAQIKPCSTFLPQAFNIAWAEALNFRDSGVPIKYFAMIHDDIEPEPLWLDTLIGELEFFDADACAAVAPIKSDKGCTSTAIATEDRWTPRRLTMREVFDLPETFTAEDAGGPLLLNTGLWVCKITEPWAEDVCFRFENRIRRNSEGKRVAEGLSEDWLNSYAMNDWGCKLIATRKVSLNHNGSSDYPNNQPWGRWERDEAYYAKVATKERELCASSS